MTRRKSRKTNPSAEPAAKPTQPMWTIIPLALAAIVLAALAYLIIQGRQSDRLPPPADQAPKLSEEVLRQSIGLADNGLYKRAASLLGSYLRQEPDDVQARLLLAETQIEMGLASLAERNVDYVLSLAPEMSAALWCKGELVELRGGQAGAFFRRSAESPDSTAETWARFGIELMTDQQFIEAEKYLRRARKGGLEDHRTLGPLGELALRADRFEEAERLLAKATETAPSLAALWGMLAVAQKNAGRPAAAEKTLRNALLLCNETEALQLKLGETLVLLHKWREAGEAFMAAAKSPVLAGRATLQAARCSYLEGDLDLASQRLESAAELLGENEKVRSLREKITSELAGPTSRPAPLSIPTTLP